MAKQRKRTPGSPAAALKELQKLAGAAYENLYRRLSLSKLLLGNQTWAKNLGAVPAVQYLQETYFRDLSGYISLQKLLTIYDTYSAEQWRMYNYDVRAMELLYDQPRLLTAPATSTDAENAKRRVAEVSYHVRYDNPTRTPADERAYLQRRKLALENELAEIDSRLRSLS